MARVLTASNAKSESRQPRQTVDCADVVAGLWISVERLWLSAERYRKLVNAVRETKAKLADPRLQNHPKRPAAVDRLEGWRLELRDIDAKAEPVRKGLARQWDGLPDRIHRFLRDSGGWPDDAETGREMANALWKMAVEGKPFPQGECGF